MTYGGYPAGPSLAQRVHDHFARHMDDGASPLPDVKAIEALVDAGFWTSLRREEGYVSRVSLALLPPDASPSPLVFESRLPLSSASLARVAPAIERAGIHLGEEVILQPDAHVLHHRAGGRQTCREEGGGGIHHQEDADEE